MTKVPAEACQELYLTIQIAESKTSLLFLGVPTCGQKGEPRCAAGAFGTDLCRQDISKENNLLLDEAALPAYAHKNPLIDFIFWRRLHQSYQYAMQRIPKGGKVLDFGCGTGVLSYALAENYEVTAVDIEFSPLRKVQEQIQFPPNINFLEGTLASFTLPQNSFDAIFALDVLEHMSDQELTSYMTQFQQLLKKDGTLIVSGPTENWLYQIGRKLAGQRFTGSYHESNIHRIISILSEQASVKRLARIIYPFTLFEIWEIRQPK